MSELALKIIAENKAKHARGEDARVLDLGNCGLTEVPEEALECVWVEELILSAEWWEYDFEQKKGAWHKSQNGGKANKIKHFPLTQIFFPMLKVLVVNSGQISNLTSIAQLQNLQQLYCSDNLIVNLTPIAQLQNLQQLYCYNNQINDLTPIAQFQNLKLLYCSYNQINDLTPIAQLQNLQQLYCFKNQISDLNPIAQLQKLQVLDCSNNPINNPPPEIVARGGETILKYFKEFAIGQFKDATIRLAEAKCLILGEGGAGKTSLARKLLSRDNDLPPEEDTTRGIEVHPLDLKLPDGTDFRLNIWDFGGQEIYHATHQFFLTKRSLYLLIDDTRKDEKTVNDPTFNYWLQTSELYGGGSPLLIVQNEKGDRSKQLDLPGMQGRFGFVKDSKATNLLTCRGLEGVWDAILYHLKQLPHVGEVQPKVWVDIRRELERLAREEGRDHISLEEYYRVCARFEMPERERALFLSSYLHDFGAFLHFQDHPLLRKMLVLSNQWATDAVYKVLDCEDVKLAFGRFTRHDLSTIWADQRYADQHDELLALMEKFELCYKLPDEKTDTWLAPQLLSVLQPDALQWHYTNNLQVRYEYEFMPKGLLSQHIVRMHRYVRQPDLAWKSGVVFERADSQALVTEAWGSRKISLRASGAHAKELLTLLSEDFDKIHSRFEGLRVKKLIPCNCPACRKSAEPHFYDHNDLARRKTSGKRTIECNLSFKDVPVIGLLDGVFATDTLAPAQLLKEGRIEEALRQMEQTEEVTGLLGQIVSAERAFNLNQITYEELELVRSKARAAAAKLL